MRKSMILLLLSLTVLSIQAHAAGRKDCQELRAEIASKLNEKGVVDYELSIVPVAEVGDQKIVGQCDGGTQRIAYLRHAAPLPTAVAATESAPAQ